MAWGRVIVCDIFSDETEKVMGIFMVYFVYIVRLNDLKEYRYIFLSNTTTLSCVSVCVCHTKIIYRK
jgi:hypothetical protein